MALMIDKDELKALVKKKFWAGFILGLGCAFLAGAGGVLLGIEAIQRLG